MPKPSPYNGVVIVDKPSGMTSHDVVDALRKIFGTKRVGHTGTLDPDATGVLVLCLGRATRLVEYLAAAEKQYIAEVAFGIETDSLDASGAVTSECPSEHLTAEYVLAILPRFRGTIEQIPPMVSARHHEGRRLYELAREGVTVERQARAVQISSLEMLDFVPGPRPLATLKVVCSAGTYIRTLAADLGSAAGTGGTMWSLRRTSAGGSGGMFSLDVAHTIEDLIRRKEEGTLQQAVLSMECAVAEWPTVRLDEDQQRRFQQGQPVDSEQIDALYETDRLIVVLDSRSSLTGIAKLQAGQLHPVKVFPVETAV